MNVSRILAANLSPVMGSRTDTTLVYGSAIVPRHTIDAATLTDSDR